MFPYQPSPPVVCIDPGHPSEVGRGTRGRKLTEIDAAWQVAILLRSELSRHHVRVILTKSSAEEMVRNKRRAEVANEAHASLMVRLHCDAATGSGFTTYYPDQQGTVDGFTGPSLDLIRRDAAIAPVFHEALASELKGQLQDNGLKGDEYTAVGKIHGALVGSIYSRVPVILVEMVVLTNPKDEEFIASKEGQKRLAHALCLATLAALRRQR